MIGEISIAGVFVPTLVISATGAYALGALLSALLRSTGLYRLVWHPALFDLACFVLLWVGATALWLKAG